MRPRLTNPRSPSSSNSRHWLAATPRRRISRWGGSDVRVYNAVMVAWSAGWRVRFQFGPHPRSASSRVSMSLQFWTFPPQHSDTRNPTRLSTASRIAAQPQGRDQRDGRAWWRSMRDAGGAAANGTRAASYSACRGHVARPSGSCGTGHTGTHRARVNLCRWVRSVRAPEDNRRGGRRERNCRTDPPFRHTGTGAGRGRLALRRSRPGDAGDGTGPAWRCPLSDRGGRALT